MPLLCGWVGVVSLQRVLFRLHWLMTIRDRKLNLDESSANEIYK